MPRVIIRADGSSTIGMGHVIRCLALADILRNNFTVSFVIQEPDDSVLKEISKYVEEIIILPATADFDKEAIVFSEMLSPLDIVVIDGYEFKTNYEKAIKSRGCKLVCIDDLHEWHHVADIILNQANSVSIKDYSAESYTKFLIGFDYILLRKEFYLTNPYKPKTTNLKNVFVNMGAADITNVTQKILEALIEIDSIEHIELMVGSVNKHIEIIRKIISLYPTTKITLHINISATELRELLASCDLAICPASGVSLECCAVGIGLISGYSAENQIDNLHTMEKQNCLINFGNFNLLTASAFKEKLLKIDLSIFTSIIESQKKMIDGKSADRVLDAFIRLNTDN